MTNYNILEKYYIKYLLKSGEKIRETLQTTLFNLVTRQLIERHWIELQLI